VEPEPLGVAGVHGPFDLEGTVTGPLRAPSVDLQLRSPGGDAHLLGSIDVRGPTPVWHADLTLPAEVQLGYTIEALRDTRVSGHVVADGEGFGWPDDLRVVVSADVAGVIEGVGPYALRGSSPLTLDHGVVTCDAMNVGAPVGSALTALNFDVVGKHGVARVVGEPYPDPTQFQEKSEYFDPKATEDKPRWWLVDFEFVEKFPRYIPLADLKADAALEDMVVVQKGTRLSINPVELKHFKRVCKMGKK
jgi:hypothetical protein